MIGIGVIGTGRIAQRFVKDVSFVKDAVVTCVYNPRSGSADRFVSEFCGSDRGSDRPIATSDMEVLFLQSDIIYIASPHETYY